MHKKASTKSFLYHFVNSVLLEGSCFKFIALIVCLFSLRVLFTCHGPNNSLTCVLRYEFNKMCLSISPCPFKRIVFDNMCCWTWKFLKWDSKATLVYTVVWYSLCLLRRREIELFTYQKIKKNCFLSRREMKTRVEKFT